LIAVPEEIEGEYQNDSVPQNILRETHSSPRERTNFQENRLSKLRHQSSGLGRSWFGRDRLGLGNKQNRRKINQYRPLAPEVKPESLAYANSIKESDEPSDDPKFTPNEPSVKKPATAPAILCMEQENQLNEQKANQNKQDKPTTIEEITSSIDKLYEKSEFF
jgi:hypothetical protein